MADGDYLSVLSHGLLVTGGGSCDYPAASDVRYGVVYASGALTGTLVVSAPAGGAGPLLHSPADILRWLLVQLGLGTDPGNAGSWPVYCSSEPHAPDNCITTYDTEQRGDGRSQISGEMFQHYGVQIRIRSVDHPTGYVKANALANALDQSVYQEVVTVSGTRYLIHAVSRSSAVLPLGKEVPASKRSLFTINLLVSLRLLS